jgi:hypothetical protein
VRLGLGGGLWPRGPSAGRGVRAAHGLFACVMDPFECSKTGDLASLQSLLASRLCGVTAYDKVRPWPACSHWAASHTRRQLGGTLLHGACKGGHVPVALFLLKNGAHVDMPNAVVGAMSSVLPTS